ncbi:MAG TPA: tRNA pseudouridine(55) synthase TruB [Lachnospiraceae bacterium]|nr:tRNA pseudouridine(55) synthase TruB [Lachnospiraceae bacterium]
MYNGIISVYKEAGFTSHDVVAKLRGILKQKKIGHTGTLDPDATGVLPVCLGSGTKLCNMLTDTDKEYRAVLLLGKVTDTQDASGKVVEEKEVRVSIQEAEEAAMSFLGSYSQIPPMYSAIKVDGKRLYQLAREGKEIERKPRNVRIHALEIESMELPRMVLRINCSKGTYIRTLCHDIGQKLGCGGIMESLERTKAGMFLAKDALSLADIEKLRDEGRLSEKIFPVDSVFSGWKSVTVKSKFQKLIDNGNTFSVDMIREEQNYMPEEKIKVYNEDGRFYGIYRFGQADGRFWPVKMFMENG